MSKETTLSIGSIERFRLTLKERGRADLTVKAYCGDLKIFLLWTNQTSGLPMLQFEKLALQWLNQMKEVKAAATTTRYLASLKVFGKYCGITLPDLEDWIGPIAAKPVAHPLDGGIDEVRKLLDACRTDIEKAFIGLCGLAGLRINEAITLPIVAYQVAEQSIRVRGKGDKYRDVPVSRELKPLLDARRRSSEAKFAPLTDHQARYLVTRLGAKVLDRKIATHDLRMTFGTELNDRGTNIRVVQELLGHASVETTQRYTRVKMDQMREAVNF